MILEILTKNKVFKRNRKYLNLINRIIKRNPNLTKSSLEGMATEARF
jgi:hypothetical protein